MGEGLHVGRLEIFGELGYQVGITAGNVQGIRIIGVGYQLEKLGRLTFRVALNWSSWS